MTRPGQPVRPIPGQVIRVDEKDYLYGIGELVLRVTAVAVQPEGEWLRVVGVEIRRNGSDGPERDVMVRMSALSRA